MTRRKKDPLRPLTAEEREVLERISRAQSEPASHVARAKALLAVADGKDYTAAARVAGRRSGDAVSQLVSRFNGEGLVAIEPRHGGGAQVIYGVEERKRIMAEFERPPDREKDGTATWSLTTLQRALRSARWVAESQHLHHLVRVARCQLDLAEGSHLVQDRHGGPQAQRGCRRSDRPRGRGKKNLIEQAYRLGESLGLSVWTQDEAGPFQTIPYLGHAWQPEGKPKCQPHEYVRNGTAKLLTLFHPSTGQVRVKGVTSCPNAVLHPWLRQELSAILDGLPPPVDDLDPETNRALWERWCAGLDPIPVNELESVTDWQSYRHFCPGRSERFVNGQVFLRKTANLCPFLSYARRHEYLILDIDRWSVSDRKSFTGIGARPAPAIAR